MKHKFKSDISGLEFPVENKVCGGSVRSSLVSYIGKEHPGFDKDSCMSIGELNDYRNKYMSVFLKQQIGELSDDENTVLNSLKEHTSLTNKLDPEEDNKSDALGARVADKVATFGGSWTFIISFGVFIFLWIAINIFWFANRGYDPYPFILLNLLLSCLAAMQAPVIMMSQNRQEGKDRERSKKDYMINLKSELEIRILHEKLDHLMLNQQQELIQMQNEQIRLLEKILKEIQSEQAAGKKI